MRSAERVQVTYLPVYPHYSSPTGHQWKRRSFWNKSRGILFLCVSSAFDPWYLDALLGEAQTLQHMVGFNF